MDSAGRGFGIFKHLRRASEGGNAYGLSMHSCVSGKGEVHAPCYPAAMKSNAIVRYL